MNLTQHTPDFFIVGAPKCGTTALDYHLSCHPEIYMAKKELHFFGKDIGMIQDELNLERYLAHFNSAKQGQLKGESSVWYLYSQQAPEEIKALNPKAKIIILLRKPVEMIPSLHGQYLYNGIESIRSFEDALKIDSNKTTGEPCALFEQRPKYIESACYHEHVKRYLDAFSPDNILILLHEDLKSNFNEVYIQCLQFLGVKNTSFKPNEKQINQRKNLKNVKLHQMSKTPPSALKKAFRTLVPSKKLRHAIMSWVEDQNVSTTKPAAISIETKQDIIASTRSDVEQLATLINKDLSHWNVC